MWQVESRPAYADGVVYVSTEENHALFAIDYKTGAKIWEYTGATQELNGSPSVSEDLVYVAALFALPPLPPYPAPWPRVSCLAPHVCTLRLRGSSR